MQYQHTGFGIKGFYKIASFAQLVRTVFPADIHQVLTDNGSEYKGKFADYWKPNNTRHCYT